MPQLFTNAARSLLQASILSTDTSLTVEAAKADLFPVANTGTGSVPATTTDWFKATLQDSSGNIEIVYVRTRAAASAILSNVMRGQEGTTVRAFSAGVVVGLRITAADVQASIALKADLVAAGGAALVGNTPAGNIAASTVQAAINELDAEKVQSTNLAATGGAALVGNAPAGNIAATTVQAALNELDAEKLAVGGNAVTATKASTLSQSGGAGAAMTFNWAGQGGQPTWLWGGNDGLNQFVYNPSNFSVNYANSAGSAGSASSVPWTGVSGRPTAVSSFQYSGNIGDGVAGGGTTQALVQVAGDNTVRIYRNTNCNCNCNCGC